ncbi:ankyrin repeat domain-containing protein [Pyruvatibacter sp. HU-CL02332]|uniref:ankyrin repeat domain-containing protein n=1 Tax=Pyruvatibacter sp. HU-CL02332 TaxID=3127650 RepID=UPI0031020712
MQTKRRTRDCVSAKTPVTILATLVLSVFVALAATPASAQLVDENEMVVAIRSGDLAQVEEAFLAGLSANERSIRGLPALIEAVRTGKREIVELMLERKARVNVPGRREGVTALEESVRINRPDLAQILIDAGADVDKTGKNGQTPLMLAAKLGHANVVQVLIDADAYLNDTDPTGRTPLELAQERRHRHTVELLIAAGAE